MHRFATRQERVALWLVSSAAIGFLVFLTFMDRRWPDTGGDPAQTVGVFVGATIGAVFTGSLVTVPLFALCWIAGKMRR